MTLEPAETLVEHPYEPGSFVGDIWYGHPEKRTLGTHQWDGLAWHELPHAKPRPSARLLLLLADARTRIAALEAEVARLRLDVEAQEALQVSAYHAGLKAGWNFCVSEDNAGMQAAMTNTDHIKELRSIREARAALEARRGEA